jgi:hypothetical protein
MRRTLDAFFVATFVAFALTSFLFDRAGALDTVGPDSADPFGRALYWYGVRYDPLVAENPWFLQVMSAISAFVFGPIYLYLAHGFLKRREAIRLPAIAWAWVMLYSMVVHVAIELWGDAPPPSTLVFAATYAIYCVAPVLLLYRVRSSPIFGPT